MKQFITILFIFITFTLAGCGNKGNPIYVDKSTIQKTIEKK
jgi:predicted small lipoprotein YifL